MTDPKQLTQDLGGTWMRSYGCAPCPCCQPERRRDQTGLTISADGGKLLLHCKKSGCAFTDILAATGLSSQPTQSDPEVTRKAELARAKQTAKLKARAQALWDYGNPIHGTHGEAYLRARGITYPLPDTLRWLPDTYHTPSGQYCSAMIAKVEPTGGVHRTFFTKKGERLTSSAKMMLGPCSGGAVRLSHVDGPLVVCEGIETGLSLLSGLLDGPHQVWAALSTSGMKALSLPVKPHQLIVATDGDKAGNEAGNILARTAHALGWSVSIMAAPSGRDWNDVLQSGVAA